VTLPNVISEQLVFLVGIFAILNPLGIIPVYLSLMAGRSSDEMHSTALKTAVAVATILILSVWVGESLLMFFGIGIPSFRVGGGLLLLIIAIAMFDAKLSMARHTHAEQIEAEAKNDLSVVPLAIPLLAGPGAISLTIVDAHQAGNWADKAVLSAGIVVIAIIIWVILWLAEPIGKRLGTTGLNIATRIMGLILAAMAVQFMADGLLKLFPGLAH
jgi:multiple antibiotic resistance protein